MKNRNCPIILLLFAALAGCKPTIKYDVKINLTRLTGSSIYDAKLVGDVIFDAHELTIDSLINKSNKLFLKGVDLYKNKKDPATAITVFKKSLLAFPRAETYDKIGDALMEVQDKESGDNKKAALEEALQAYRVAEYLHYNPASVVYYNMACAENMLDNKDYIPTDRISFHINWAILDLRNAFMNGFSDTAMLQKDTRLNSIMKTEAYKQLITELNARQKPDSKPETIYDLYLALFPDISQPFIIPPDSVEMKKYKTSINFDFARFIPEMENTSFGRDVSHDYYVVGKLTGTGLYTAILYTSTEFDEGDDEGSYGIEPVYTKLTTYTPEGNIIDSRLISCQCTSDKAKAVRIENNIITTEDYKTTWKYTNAEMDSSVDHQNDSFRLNNAIVKTELLERVVYQITPIGKIVEASDSTKVALR